MFTLGLTDRIWVCTTSQDGRKSFDGLQAVVTSHLGKNPMSGDLYVFRNRHGDPVHWFRSRNGILIRSVGRRVLVSWSHLGGPSSTPPRIITNSVAVMLTSAVSAFGNAKVPFSNRRRYMANPSPSQARIFNRSRPGRGNVNHRNRAPSFPVVRVRASMQTTAR